MSHDRFSHETSEFPLNITAAATRSASQTTIHSTPFAGSGAYSSEPAITNSGAIDVEIDKQIRELKVPFGLDSSEIEDCLITLGHEIGLGAVFPQKFSATTERVCDDFEMITVSFTYARPRESGS